jgi:hypothetical protein
MNDIAASVRARLLNVAKAQDADFNQVLVRFALERILYSLSQATGRYTTCLHAATMWAQTPMHFSPPVRSRCCVRHRALSSTRPGPATA